METRRIIPLLAMAAMAFSMPLAAQDKIETTVEADIVSHYVWRGQDCGHVSIQPTLGLACKGFSLSAWGSVGLDADDTEELDLTAAYEAGGFHVGITDYWFNDGDGRYFAYAAHRTAHVFEANIGYDFGPVALQWYTNFAGNDGLTPSGKRAYSSYAEVTAPFRLGGCEWEAALGLVPYATTAYDVSGFAVTNVQLKATKSLSITDRFTLPLFAGIVANPAAEKAWLFFGFTLRP